MPAQPLHIDALRTAARVIDYLNSLDEALEGSDYYATGTIELWNRNDFKVGEITFEDDFWVFRGEKA